MKEMQMRLLHGKSKRYQLSLVAVALLALVAFFAAGRSGPAAASTSKSGVAGASHTMSTAVVKTRKISGFGAVLVNKSGRTLYLFMKDQRKRVTCTGSCKTFWHALTWKGSGKPRVGGAAKSSLIGTVRSSGSKVVTYNKWPLYTYVGDSSAGQAKGEGSTLNGAKWYVVSPKGTPIKHKSSSGGSGGGGGWG
jgi:predicted lipoprotein with Yx(FWY)xxD motif